MTNNTTALRFKQLSAQGIFSGIKTCKKAGLSTADSQKELHSLLIEIMALHLGLNA